MKPEVWRQVEELWDRASGLTETQRQELLAELEDTTLRRELGSLLAHDRDDSFLEGLVLTDPRETTAASSLLGRRLGSYQITELIGEGGMSHVYLAERIDEHFRKQVAIKVLRGWPERELRRQFLAERQILADLEHPNIARLLDGGTTPEGMPYVVMELVRGVPITELCRARHLGISERLRLFQQLCDTVHDAHQHLVVHRDLKPSNVLVTESGQIKLLDFGIAKLLHGGEEVDDPASRVRALTPSYASPEQLCGGTITTATDVYSLGVMLYELLAGRRPFDRERARDDDGRDEAGPPPSIALLEARPNGSARKLARQLRGDLDAIVLKAMAPRPDQRYPSARSLAEDIERHLADRPIEARSTSTGERLRKLIRRHPVAAPTIFLMVVALLVLTVLASLLARRSLRERDEARTQRERAEQVVRFLEETFQASDPDRGSGEAIRAKDLLDQQTAGVLREFPQRPDLRARLLNHLAEIYQNLGIYPEAQLNFDRALEIRKQLYGERHLEVAETQTDLAWLQIQRGEYPQAMALLDAALATLDALAPGDGPLRALGLERRGMALVALGKFSEAEPAHRQALAIRRRLWGESHELVGQALNNLAECVGYQGRAPEALELCERALAIIEATRGRDSIAGASALFVRGDQRYSLGDFAAAVADYDASLAIFRQRVSDTHPSVAILLNNRGRALRHMGDFAQAEASYRQALEIVRGTLGSEHREVATILGNLAHVVRNRGRYQEALELSLQAQASYRSLLGDHYTEGLGLSRTATILRDWGKLEAAAEAYRRSLENLERHLGPTHSSLAGVLIGLGKTRLEQGRSAEAEQLLEKALVILEPSGDSEGQWLVEARCDLGDTRRAQGDLRGAEAHYRLALDHLSDKPRDAFERAEVWCSLALTRLLDGRPAEATGAIRAATRALAGQRPEGHWQLAKLRVAAVAVEAVLGQNPIDEAGLSAAFETLRRELGERSPEVHEALRWVVWASTARGDASDRFRAQLEDVERSRQALASERLALP